jgi:hypothetical protein
MKSKIGTLGDAELALTSSIFAQMNQFTQEIQRFSGNDAIVPCPSCGSTKINLLRMLDYCHHYAARRCGGCDTFRGWQPKPENQEKRQRQQTAINQLLMSPQLSQ